MEPTGPKGNPQKDDEPSPESFRECSVAVAVTAAVCLFATLWIEVMSVYIGIGLALVAIALAIVYVGFALERRA